MSNWQTKKLVDLGMFTKGAGIPKDFAQSGTLPAVRYGELYTSYDTRITRTRSKISPEIADDSVKIYKDDILFAGSGETIEDIGKSATFQLAEGYAGGDVVILSPDKKVVDSLYLAYALNANVARRELRKLGQGQSIVHIYRKDLEKLKLNLPMKSEQRCVVTILEVWDNYLELLDKKITLKEHLKKGVMHQLLTGKKRLPGSTGEWVKLQIKDIATIGSGYGFPERLQGRKDLELPFIKVSDMNIKGNEQKILKWNNTISQDDMDNIGAKALPPDAIIFPKIGAAISTNKKRLLARPTIVDNNVMALIPKHGGDINFLFNWMLAFDLRRWANDSGVPSIRKSEVEKQLISIPFYKSEREAIGKLLGIFSSDLEFLQNLRTQIINQKKYLLQNLTTGTIRTPENLHIKGAN
jgi:type I restriction enzyme S subunit